MTRNPCKTTRLAFALCNRHVYLTSVAFRRRFGPKRTVAGHLGARFATTTVSRPSNNGSDNLPQVIPTKGVPIHLYTYEIEPDSLEQLKVLAESPLPTDYIAAMPDVHLGKGVTIGSVFASEHYICPMAVGVDIGCGMAAIPIQNLYKKDLDAKQLHKIQQLIKERIPTGFSQHRKTLKGTHRVIEEITETIHPSEYLKNQLLLPRVTDQLGTLGGGNHFLEIVYEEKSEQIWLMLHSGSRNIGNRVATHYDNTFKVEMKRQGKDTRPLQGIHYMPIESELGQNYLRDMEWCQQYAWQNRRAMQDIMLDIVEQVTGHGAELPKAVNIHHNYCSCETCGNGRKLWVTRKGATSAKRGEMGIIPGSMGSGSYITRGLGNPLSWSSSSHGAGRRMSRTKAHSAIPQEEFEQSMKGIVCDTHPSVKDEAPQAYKDLTEVMMNQESLTEIVHHLLPLVNVKGFESKLPKKYRKAASNQELENRRKKKKKIH